MEAATLFFAFHHCMSVKCSNLEKPDPNDRGLPPADALYDSFARLENNAVVSLSEIGDIVQLILKGYLWANK